MFSNERIRDDLCSQKLKYQMDLKNISVRDLAKLLDMSPNTVRNWLNEKNNPNVLALIKMTQIFECSVADLIRTKKKTPAVIRTSSIVTEVLPPIKKAKRTKNKKRKKHH